MVNTTDAGRRGHGDDDHGGHDDLPDAALARPVAAAGDEPPHRLDARERVVEALRLGGALSRAELARRTTLAPSTVSSVVADLVGTGTVADVPGPHVPASGTRGGRPATRVSLHRAAGAVVGIDLGKRHVRVAVADLGHTVLAERAVDVEPDRPAAEGIATAGDLVAALLAEAGLDRGRVTGVAMGIPGPVRRRDGMLGDSTILPGWVGVRAADAMTEALGLPVRVDNDANLGALGEATWGAARGASEVAYVKVGTGIGAGLIIGGQPFSGVGGTAGELGHVVVDPQGPDCRCGNRGCLETLAGGAAVVAAVRPELGDVTLAQVVTAAREGDRVCAAAIARSGRAIGAALATLCNLVNPQRIVLGGDLGSAGDLVLPPLRRALTQHAMRSVVEDVAVVESALGDRAEVLGAVALALRSRARPR